MKKHVKDFIIWVTATIIVGLTINFFINPFKVDEYEVESLIFAVEDEDGKVLDYYEDDVLKYEIEKGLVWKHIIYMKDYKIYRFTTLPFDYIINDKNITLRIK